MVIDIFAWSKQYIFSTLQINSQDSRKGCENVQWPSNQNMLYNKNLGSSSFRKVL